MRSISAITRMLCTGVFAWCIAMCLPGLAQDRPPILGISHVAVKATDLEKTIAFYRDFLGFADEYHLNNPKDGSLEMVCFKVSDDQCIQVFPELKQGENSFNHFAFQVADAQAWSAYLAKQGLKTPAKVPLGQHKNANFTVKDPDKFTIEFTQYTPDGWTVRDKGKFLPDTRISDHISHAGIVVTDMPATVHFYGDILGLKQTQRPTADAIPGINMNLPGAGDYLELMNAKSGPHFCMDVPDVEKAKAKLEVSSYRPKYEKPIAQRVGKNGKRILEVYDPDGVRVEFMETVPVRR
jgi:catechol 2,3-dioxygenase-like lactoylglutathione lyase family enzyme